MNTSTTTPWQAHEALNYDEKMLSTCENILARIKNDAQYRVDIRNDPRPLHAEIFGQFAPLERKEYAGNYRGTPNTALANRIAAAPSVLEEAAQLVFEPPDKVLRTIAQWKDAVAMRLSIVKSVENKIRVLSFQFAWFGRIHPFLDGNGHVQRLLFASLATEMGLSLDSSFAIHPRPFGLSLTKALEMFHRAKQGSSEEQLALVDECLARYIA